MNVIIQIQGREAIPVRAIPLLTYWHFFSPDVVAQTLAAEEFSRTHVHGELQAYRLEEGVVMAVRQIWWESWAVRELRACHEKIKATGSNDEVGYHQWRDESLPILPAGVFVWREELESFHARNWNSRFRAMCGGIPEDDGEAPMPSIDAKLGAYLRDGLAYLEKWRELDFSPLMPPEMSAVVMEGFVVYQQAATVGAANSSRAEATSKANAERKERMAAAIKKLASLRYQVDPTDVEAAGRALENAMSALSPREAAIEALQAHRPAQNAPPAPVEIVGASVALPKQRAQEVRILELLKAQGHDPKMLPKRTPGTSGPKADIRTLALKEPALFTIKTFDTAWQRLRDAGDVAGAE